jgi:lipopolysaccharide export system permease protein
MVFLVTLIALTTFMLLVGAVQVAINKGLGAKQIVLALPYLLPNALMFAVPGTILFAVSMVYGRMSASNELLALKSLGLSPMVVIWPALALSVLLSFTTVWLNDLAMSWGFFGVERVVIDSAEEIAYSVLRKHKSFKSDAFEVTVKGFDKTHPHLLIAPVFSIPASDGSGTVTITAKSAELRSVPGSGKLTLIIYDAVVEGPDFYGEAPNSVLERELDINPDVGREVSPSHLALSEIPAATARQQEVIERLEERMVALAGLQILGGDFDHLSGSGWNEEVHNLRHQKYQYYRMLTEPPRRWANGFSCLCFTLVGAGMAIRMRNSDMLTSFALCFFPILIAYYPLLMFALDRAKAGEIDPHAVWLANVFMVLWGLWLLRRVIRY